MYAPLIAPNQIQEIIFPNRFYKHLPPSENESVPCETDYYR